MKIKKDKYLAERGGEYQIYNITCARCDKHLCYYQKDGPGELCRLYLDRIDSGVLLKSHYVICKCPDCNKLIGIYYIFQKEQRPALKLFVGAINTKEKLT